LRQLEQAGVEQVPIALEEVLGRVSAHDVKDTRTGEIVLATNEEITEEKLELLRARRCRPDRGALPRRHHIGSSLRNTLLQDKIASPRRRSSEIYRRLRPGDPPRPRRPPLSSTTSSSTPERYDLSRVGRLS